MYSNFLKSPTEINVNYWLKIFLVRFFSELICKNFIEVFIYGFIDPPNLILQFYISWTIDHHICSLFHRLQLLTGHCVFIAQNIVILISIRIIDTSDNQWIKWINIVQIFLHGKQFLWKEEGRDYEIRIISKVIEYLCLHMNRIVKIRTTIKVARHVPPETEFVRIPWTAVIQTEIYLRWYGF